MPTESVSVVVSSAGLVQFTENEEVIRVKVKVPSLLGGFSIELVAVSVAAPILLSR